MSGDDNSLSPEVEARILARARRIADVNRDPSQAMDGLLAELDEADEDTPLTPFFEPMLGSDPPEGFEDRVACALHAEIASAVGRERAGARWIRWMREHGSATLGGGALVAAAVAAILIVVPAEGPGDPVSGYPGRTGVRGPPREDLPGLVDRLEPAELVLARWFHALQANMTTSTRRTLEPRIEAVAPDGPLPELFAYADDAWLDARGRELGKTRAPSPVSDPIVEALVADLGAATPADRAAVSEQAPVVYGRLEAPRSGEFALAVARFLVRVGAGEEAAPWIERARESGDEATRQAAEQLLGSGP